MVYLGKLRVTDVREPVETLNTAATPPPRSRFNHRNGSSGASRAAGVTLYTKHYKIVFAAQFKLHSYKNYLSLFP
ncbi:hypothetical protein J6590_037739 [Homalodisca vitripennis]|nr:hypothetical protein J6590_037739 [Homalodisca vitripennis]